MTPRLTLLALAAALCLSLAPAALAKSPPKGDYGCTYTTLSGTFFAGTLNIVSKKKYSVNDGKKHRYKTKGKRIRFVKGEYRTLYFGKWSKTTSSSGPGYQVKLFGKKDKKEKLVCSRSGG